MSMRAKPWDVSDELWERIRLVLPVKERRFRYPGRKPFDDRLALQGILFVLHRDRLGASAAGVGVRLRDDRMAAAAGLAGSRCVGATPWLPG
jgi:hypothetical protein